jgi:hypothetical protein
MAHHPKKPSKLPVMQLKKWQPKWEFLLQIFKTGWMLPRELSKEQ